MSQRVVRVEDIVAGAQAEPPAPLEEVSDAGEHEPPRFVAVPGQVVRGEQRGRAVLEPVCTGVVMNGLAHLEREHLVLEVGLVRPAEALTDLRDRRRRQIGG